MTGPSGPSSGDLLAAASLLLAILAAFLGVWYGEINAAASITPPEHLEDAEPARRQVQCALFARALPLFMASLVLSAIFLPEAIHLLIKFGRGADKTGLWAAITNYDPVSLSLFVLPVAMLAVAVFVGVPTVRLLKLGSRLRPHR